MPVTQAALTSGFSETDATSYSTASITPSADQLILAAVTSSAASGIAAPTVTGNGLTWVQVASIALTDGFRMVTVFRSMGAAPSAGAVTFDFGATTQVRCLWAISEFASVDTTGTNGSGAVVQSATNTAASGNPATATLAAFGSTDNATYGAWAGSFNQTAAQTAGTGFTKIHDVDPTTENQSLGTEWRNDNDTTVNATWTDSAASGTIGVEIKFSSGAGGDFEFSLIRGGKLVGGGMLLKGLVH